MNMLETIQEYFEEFEESKKTLNNEQKKFIYKNYNCYLNFSYAEGHLSYMFMCSESDYKKMLYYLGFEYEQQHLVIKVNDKVFVVYDNTDRVEKFFESIVKLESAEVENKEQKDEETKVLSIIEIAREILKRKEEIGEFDTQQGTFYGWELRKNCYPYNSYPKAYREAKTYNDKMFPTNEDILEDFASLLLKVFKRDRKIKADRSEDDLKNCTINN